MAQTPSSHLEKYCYDCHADGVDKGGIDFDRLKKSDLKSWQKVWDVIEKEQMPPPTKKRPSIQQKKELLNSITKNIFKIDPYQKIPQKILLYRLSNAQFSNSLQVVFGYYDYKVTQQLPAEATTLGFDNIGSAMNISSIHLESYQKLAFQVSQAMLNKNTKKNYSKTVGEKWLKTLADNKPETLRKFLQELTLKTFRRPSTDREIQLYIQLFEQIKQKTGSHRKALMAIIEAMIVSPSHLFRTELFRTKTAKGKFLKLDEYALASRLAFFLWNSPPDYRLLKLAANKKIHQDLSQTVQYMIAHKRFKNFAFSFGEQWLHIKSILNNPNKVPFNAMKIETLTWLQYLFQKNRPLTELFTSKVTFINPVLANRYKLPAFKKDKFQKYTFPESSHRVGLLTQPSILIATSNPDRTSPVKRGVFLLESVLGMPPPPAPADVTGIETNKNKNGKEPSFKELLAIHRADKKCASCHNMMDPLGLAMENFDNMGNWRTHDNKEKISISETWRNYNINSFKDLQKIISKEYHPKVIKCLTEKIMIYALSRGLTISDHSTLVNLVDKLNKPEATFQDLILEIIKSTTFQYRAQ